MHESELIIPSLDTPRGHFFLAHGIPISLAVGMGVIVPVRKIARAHVLDIEISQTTDVARVESFDDNPTVVTIRLQCRPRVLGRHDIAIKLFCEDSTGRFSFDLILVFYGVESTLKSCIDYIYMGEESVGANGVNVSPYILHSLREGSEFTIMNSNEVSSYAFECISYENRVLFTPVRGTLNANSSLTVKIQIVGKLANISGIIPMTICLSATDSTTRAEQYEELLAYHASVATVSSPAKVRIPTLRARESVTIAMTDSCKLKRVETKISPKEFFDYSLTHKPDKSILQEITITLFGYLPEPVCSSNEISRELVNHLVETQLEKMVNSS